MMGYGILSDDDFFLTGTSSEEADTDDEWTESTRDRASSASGNAASSMSSDERNQVSARALMLPPKPSMNSLSNSVHRKSRLGSSSSKNSSIQRSEMSTSSTLSKSRSSSSFRAGGSCNSKTGNSSNLSSNSDAHKPCRKRRPKKRKQQVYHFLPKKWKLYGPYMQHCRSCKEGGASNLSIDIGHETLKMRFPNVHKN